MMKCGRMEVWAGVGGLVKVTGGEVNVRVDLESKK